MRRVRDRELPEPFRAWVDRDEPLPSGVTVLPRTINVSGEVWSLVGLGLGSVAVGVPTAYVVQTHADGLGTGGWVVFALAWGALLCWLLWVARRLWHAIGARRDQKAGRLRQGILVGPEGVLVRHVPNWCYPVPMDRFVRAEKWSGGGTEGSDYLRIVTLDGTVDVADEHFAADAAEVNQAVSAARCHPPARRGG